MALPKATVQLQPVTQPLGTSFAQSIPSLQAKEEEEDEEGGEGLANILSIVGFVAAVVVLSLQLMTANTWISAADNPKTGEWSQLMD
jgi:hypothetical protein